jgi:diguanylate cyclase (GGDEF)-like protein
MSDRAKTILIVDDTPANVALLVGTLKSEWRTKVATSGEKALAIARGDPPPDLILLDIMMPGMDGYEVCSLLQADEATRAIPIIFVTAMNEVQYEEKGLSLGAMDYIVKPISPPIVRARVRTHLTLAEQTAKLKALVATLEKQQGELAEWNHTLEDRVTEAIVQAERLRHIAFHDALTGLANRVLLLDRLEHAISHAQREGGGVALMFIDLDRFKAVNDTFGHDVGDALLKEVARLLSECRRASDTVARMGGDEFVILLESPASREVHAEMAQQIIAQLSTPMAILGNPVQIGASVGIASFPEDGTDLAQLMKSADSAMYAAKTAGRGCYRFFDLDMTAVAVQKQKLAEELRASLGNGQMELFYQPLVRLKGGQAIGLEALLRWRHPILGMMPTREFYAVAEESGFIADLDRWALEEAARQLAVWRNRNLPRLPVAVNLSSRQWADLPQRILELRQCHGLAADELSVEFAEGAVMGAPEGCRKLLTELRAIGVSVTLDHFGAGMSSLAQLGQLPLQALKIHRSFILENDFQGKDDGSGAQTVRGMLALGWGLGLQVHAEGVETAGQAKLLSDLGCIAGQGHHFARPMSADETAEWLKGQAPPQVVPQEAGVA